MKTKYYRIDVEDQACPGGWDSVDFETSKKEAILTLKDRKRFCSYRHRIIKVEEEIISEDSE